MSSSASTATDKNKLWNVKVEGNSFANGPLNAFNYLFDY